MHQPTEEGVVVGRMLLATAVAACLVTGPSCDKKGIMQHHKKGHANKPSLRHRVLAQLKNPGNQKTPNGKPSKADLKRVREAYPLGMEVTAAFEKALVAAGVKWFDLNFSWIFGSKKMSIIVGGWGVTKQDENAARRVLSATARRLGLADIVEFIF